MTKYLVAAGGLAVAVGVGALVLILMLVSAIAGGQQSASAAPVDSQCSLTAPDLGSLPNLDSEQSKNAGIIIAVAYSVFPKNEAPRAAEVGIATAYQESTLRNLHYGDLDSLGLFQQRSAWAPAADREDPEKAARMFFTGGQAGQRGLKDVPGWQALPIAIAAQSVQVSFDGSLYAQWIPLAEHVVSAAVDSGKIQPVASSCQRNVPAGTVVFPLPAHSGYVDDHNFGGYGSHWASFHTGDDFSVACGTPVFAVTGGTIIIRHDQAWAGPNLVEVSTGKGKLTTWYAHMQSVYVHDGQVVKPGQHIGDVGAEGNATGCHLHLEVHPHGGTIYQDPIDPSPWLARNVGKTLA